MQNSKNKSTLSNSHFAVCRTHHSDETELIWSRLLAVDRCIAHQIWYTTQIFHLHIMLLTAACECAAPASVVFVSCFSFSQRKRTLIPAVCNTSTETSSVTDWFTWTNVYNMRLRKETCDYIFYNNLNNNSPITIILAYSVVRLCVIER